MECLLCRTALLCSADAGRHLNGGTRALVLVPVVADYRVILRPVGHQFDKI